MHVRILDKYIFREVCKAFLFGICAFSAVFIGSGTLFKIAKYITDYGASLSSVVKVFVFGLPSVIMWTFPMSMLLATLLTFGRLSSSSEITAMKSCGIGFFRIAAPAILLGFIVSICAILFNEYVVPWANTAYRNVVYYEIQGNSGMKSQDHVILKDIQNGKIQRLLYARRYDADTETLQGLTLQEFNDDGKVVHVENADFAEYGDSQWVMHNGMLYDITEGQSEHSLRFDKQVLPIKASPKQIVREQKDPEELTMKELEAYDIGLMLTDVKIQDAEMPTDEVNEAYKAVLSALQSKEATINLAQAYRESKIPEMEAEVKSITLQAEYDKQKRINEAKMQIAMFEAMYGQYKLNPDATRLRMYHEALQEFLPGTKVYIDTSKDGGTEKLLPIESFYDKEAEK